MGVDSRAAVTVFLFYILYTVFSANTVGFLPPIFMEPYLLGGISLLYFILSIRSLYSILFALALFHFTYLAAHPQLPETGATWLQKIAFIIPLLLPVTLYAHVFMTFSTQSKPMRIWWTLHVLFFLITLGPVFVTNSAMVSLAAGVLQMFAGVVLISHHTSKLEDWKKRVLLLMILIVFFDILTFIYLLTLAN